MTTARYTFTQFVTSLQENLQLQEETSRAKAGDTFYGLHETHPQDVRFRGNRPPIDTIGAHHGVNMKGLLELHIRVHRPELVATLGRGVHLTNKIAVVDAEAL